MSEQTKTPETPIVEDILAYQSKDEMNLAEFPVVKLGSRDKREVIVYEAWVKEDDTGKRQKRKWEVRAASGVGLPDEFGDRVLVGLMTLTAQQGFNSPKVTFSEYQLLKILGLTDGKRNYQALEKVLKQLVGVTIYSERAFWDNSKKRRVTSQEAFHIVERFWLRKWEEDAGKRLSEDSGGYIVWSETFWKSFQAGYIKNLDLPFYLSLENAIARRLYRFLDKWMYYRDECEIDIFDLVGRLGMVRYKYPSEAKKKLKPAFDELIRQGYLADVEVYKKGRYTRVRFLKVPKSLPYQAILWEQDGVVGELNDDRSATKDGPKMVEMSTLVDRKEAAYQRWQTADELKMAWAQILENLEEGMLSATFDSFLSNTVLLTIEAGEAVIGLANESGKDWLENRMSRRLTTELKQHVSTTVKSLRFVALEEYSGVANLEDTPSTQ